MYGYEVVLVYEFNNIKTIQTFENKVLRNIINAPWYMVTVKEVIKRLASQQETRLHLHVNAETLLQLDN